jgi:hypothetical protein
MYKIECIEPERAWNKDRTERNGEIQGGDTVKILNSKYKNRAIQLAKDLSKLPEFYEIMVIKETNDDPEYQAYFKNGKLKTRMF